MVDFKGQELNVGDKVIFINTEVGTNHHLLGEAEVVRFTPQKCEIKFPQRTWHKRITFIDKIKLVEPKTLYKLA